MSLTWQRHRTVDPGTVGSNPINRPSKKIRIVKKNFCLDIFERKMLVIESFS
jgi:hypothetical protein